MKEDDIKKNDRNFDRLTILVSIGMMLALIPVSIYTLIYPYSSAHLASLLPLYLRNPLVTIIQFGFQLYLLELLGCSVVIHNLFITSYLYRLTQMLVKDFRPNRPSYETLEELRSPSNFSITYRTIQILHKISMEQYGIIILPLQSLETQLAIMCLYTLITQGTILHGTVVMVLISFAIGSLVPTAGMLWICGKFESISKKTINSWKYFSWPDKDLKYINKFRKSCQPLRIGLQGVYTIKKISVLKFLQTIVRGTFRALLALK